MQLARENEALSAEDTDTDTHTETQTGTDRDRQLNTGRQGQTQRHRDNETETETVKHGHLVVQVLFLRRGGRELSVSGISAFFSLPLSSECYWVLDNVHI